MAPFIGARPGFLTGLSARRSDSDIYISANDVSVAHFHIFVVFVGRRPTMQQGLDGERTISVSVCLSVCLSHPAHYCPGLPEILCPPLTPGFFSSFPHLCIQIRAGRAAARPGHVTRTTGHGRARRDGGMEGPRERLIRGRAGRHGCRAERRNRRL